MVIHVCESDQVHAAYLLNNFVKRMSHYEPLKHHQ